MEKWEVQAEINRLSATLPSLGVGSPAYNEAVTKIGQLRQELERNMQFQGATDASGRLLSARQAMPQYLDQNYLNLRRQQTQDEAQQALSQGLRAAKQNQLSGNYANIGEVMGQTEAIQNAANQQLSGDVRNENLRALGEAGNELNRKQAYATQLTEAERADLNNKITNELTKYGATQQQIAMAQQTLSTMPDSFLEQALGLIMKGGGGAIMGYLTGGGIAGVAPGIGKALGL